MIFASWNEQITLVRLEALLLQLRSGGQSTQEMPACLDSYLQVQQIKKWLKVILDSSPGQQE